MKAATLFSGIGAPEVSMPHWQWLWHAEIEKFPNAVMAHHFPQSKNLGDVGGKSFIERAQSYGNPDVIVFGSPCQSFSIAGRRLGLDDTRGNLALIALGIINRLKPRWFVFENVPGLLSSSEGRDFGLFLRTVDELGYSGAWTMLDAQYFGLAQRRERVFFIGCLDGWRNPAAVLFEPESLCGNTAPRRAPGQRPAPTIAARTEGGGGLGTDFDCDGGLIADVAWALQERDNKGADSSTKDGHLIIADPIQANEHRTYSTAGNNPRPRNLVMAFDETQITSRENRSQPQVGNASHPLAANALPPTIAGATVRRLLPLECERLQGFPDGYTAIRFRGKPAADGPRYRALGNSMAVPVMRWILSRIEIVSGEILQ